MLGKILHGPWQQQQRGWKSRVLTRFACCMTFDLGTLVLLCLHIPHRLLQARQLVLDQRECRLQAVLLYLGADVRCANASCRLSVAACFQTAVCAKEASMAASPSLCPHCLHQTWSRSLSLSEQAKGRQWPPGCRASAKALSAAWRASACRPHPSRAATSVISVLHPASPARAHGAAEAGA